MIIASIVFLGVLFGATTLTAKADEDITAQTETGDFFFTSKIEVGYDMGTLYQVTFQYFVSEMFLKNALASGSDGIVTFERINHDGSNDGFNWDTKNTTDISGRVNTAATDGYYSFPKIVVVDAAGLFNNIQLKMSINDGEGNVITAESQAVRIVEQWKTSPPKETRAKLLANYFSRIYSTGSYLLADSLYYVKMNNESGLLNSSDRVFLRTKRFNSDGTYAKPFLDVLAIKDETESAAELYQIVSNGRFGFNPATEASLGFLDYIDFFPYGDYFYARIYDYDGLVEKYGDAEVTFSEQGIEGNSIELATVPDDFGEYILNLQNENELLKQEIEIERQNYQNALSELDRANRQIESTQQEIAALEAEILENGKALLALESTIDELQQSLSDKDEDLEYANEEISRYESQAKELNWQIEQLAAMRDELQSSLNAKIAYIEQLEDDVLDYQNHSKELNYQLEQLEQELADAKKTMGENAAQLFDKWQEQIDQNDELKKENDGLKAENEALKESLADKEKEPTVKFGCGSTIDGNVPFIIGAIILALAVLLIKRRKNER